MSYYVRDPLEGSATFRVIGDATLGIGLIAAAVASTIPGPMESAPAWGTVAVYALMAGFALAAYVPLRRLGIPALGVGWALVTLALTQSSLAAVHAPAAFVVWLGTGFALIGFPITALGLVQWVHRSEALHHTSAQAVDSAAKSARSYQRLFDETPMGYMEIDGAGRIRNANPAADAILGRAPGTLPGFALGDLPWDLGSVLAGGGGEGRSLDTTYDHPDGAPRDIEAHRHFTTAADGEAGAQIVFLVDVTERNHSARERSDLKERLEQGLRLGTMGTMSGGIAHDFNNLLAPILGYVEMMQMDVSPDSPLFGDLEQVRSAAGRAKDLVGQILRFSRLDQPTASQVLFQTAAREVSGLLRASLPATITVSLQVDSSCPPVSGSAIQLHQILLNLCTNASHAMPGGGTIRVSVDQTEGLATDQTSLLPPGDGPFVRVRVADTGHGMDASTMEKMFEPFFTTKPVGEGTGLGLSTVRGIVNELGGTITATSTPGQGTTFTMLFCPHVGADAEAGAVGESRGLRGEGHIMVVDDDEGVLHVTARCLSRTGYRVAAFQSSREALDAFQLDPETFDLVLTDQTMPELTGLELSGQVRQLRPEVPIILTSGHGDTIQGADLERIGSCEFLPKPASASGIALAVERGLRRLTPPSTPIAS